MAEFVIRYEIEGFDGEQEAGPYEGYDLVSQKAADILGYEGVKNVRIERHRPEVPLPEVPHLLSCSECGFSQHADRRTGAWYASMLVTKERGVEFRFQCCPQHAQQADEKFTPIELDGFETWKGPEHDIRPDHVVVAEPEDLAESPASEIQRFANESTELSPKTPFGLSESIKQALAQHKAKPLEWEKINETTERAWDAVAGEHVYRPFLGDRLDIKMDLAICPSAPIGEISLELPTQGDGLEDR